MFEKASNKTAYLKCGILGFEGSGKTYTASTIAIGLHHHIKAKKPIGFIATEPGVDFMVKKFEEEKIPLEVERSRAFVDLLDGVNHSVKNHSILIIDSITHIWNEFMTAFQKKKDIKRIAIHHWGELKTDWRVFTDMYINSKLHIILCGRAGYEFDNEKDDEGFSELRKTGTKMRVEGNLSFEPSLLIEMERRKENKIGGTIINKAWILKDRAYKINGKCFNMPCFNDFLPHINALNLGGEHLGVNTEKSSENFFNSSPAKWKKEKEIALEEIKDEILLIYPGTTVAEKKGKVELLQELFGTSSWTAISTNFKLKELETAREKLLTIKKEYFKNKKEETKNV